MKDCPQFNGTLDFYFSTEENLNLIDHYFPGHDFKNKTVLDAGCRNGGLTQAFSLKGANTFGIDINKNAIEKAKATFRVPQFYHGDISNLGRFMDNTFDLIFCSGTLPYLKPHQLEKALLEFKRIIKPDGKILLAFQKEKSPLFILSVKIYNLLPSIFRPFLIILALIYFKTLNLKYIKYALGEGLVGINFGYPDFLLNFEIPTPDTRLISSKFSKSFLWEKL